MKKFHIILFFLFGSTIIGWGQNLSTKLAGQFNSFREKYIQEKIYISTDRQFYLTGELIWFKVYCVDATFHKPSQVSKVAYVEILNRNNEPVAQGKIELEQGIGEGSFFLPTSISSDNYVLRGYTNWMKNLSPELYFHKVVSIVNPFVRMEKPEDPISDAHFEFFPEGGSLVNSVPTRVAYRLSSSGNRSGIRGFLLDDKNDTIKHLTTDKNGIGSCELTAYRSKKYRVLLKSGKANSFQDFPDALSLGYSMKLIETAEQIEIQITKTSESEVKDEDVILFIHTRNILVRNEARHLAGGQVSFSIQKSELMQGVSHITIFNEQSEAVCERLYYKEPLSAIGSLEVMRPQAAMRSKNSLQFSSLGQSKNVSVSISRMDSLPVLPQFSISSYLGLLSDIGNEELPIIDELGPKEIDNLLLTRSWKRFKWEEVLKNSVSVKHFPELRGLVVHATVTDEKSLPAKEAIVYLSSPGKIFSFHNSKSDQDGNVSFELNNFYGNQRLIAQTNRTLDSTSIVEIQNPFSDQFARLTLPDLKLDQSHEKRLLERSVRMQAQNIFFENFENDFRKHKIDSLPFYGKADENYNLEDYTRFPIMEEVMREYVPGVIVRKKKDGFNFFVLDKKHNLLFKDNPLILLDGVPVFEPNEMIQFDPLKVKRLEVVTGKYFHGHLELPGIVSYFTYQGDLSTFSIRSKNRLVDFEGLQNQRVFFSPMHSTDSESRLPDPRYLLSWIPALQEVNLDFFTSDVPGTFLVEVEGLTKEGKAIKASTTFTVVGQR